MKDQRAGPSRVLVVESDPRLLQELASMIDKLGFEVHVATTAEQGLDRLLEYGYVCLVTGQGLPDRRGTEMIEAVLRAGATLPCVLVADFQEADVEQALASGAFAVIRTGSRYWAEELPAVVARAAQPRSGTLWKVDPAAADRSRTG